jgi:hypothetical protein
MTKVPPAHKKCVKCGIEKVLEGNFNRRRRSKDGFRPTCKDCDALVRDAYMQSLRSGGPQKPQEVVEEPSEVSEVPSETPEAPSQMPSKVIGHIGVPSATAPRIREVAVSGTEDIEKAMADEYARILNEKLPVRQRARLMVKIARNLQGFNASLALKAISDINLATGVTSKAGTKVDLGPLFVLPEGSDVKMSG